MQEQTLESFLIYSHLTKSNLSGYIPSSCHLFFKPLTETILQDLLHPWVPATLNCFGNG